MAHVFISYSRKDNQYLKVVYENLLDQGFKKDQIWHDDEIYAGERWVEEIERALEDTIILVLIVTANSLHSRYVNYEWAWAVGNGIDVFPLIFEEIKDNIKHPVLNNLQYADCTEKIPPRVFDQIRDAWEVNLSVLLGLEISKLLENFRILARVVLWAYPYDIQNFHGEPDHLDLIKYAKNLANETSSKIVAFASIRYGAFTRKQKRQIHKIAHAITMLERKFNNLAYETQFIYPKKEYISAIREIDKYRKESFEPVASSFAHDKGYEELDKYLSALSAGEKPNDEPFIAPPMIIAIKNLGEISKRIEKWIFDIQKDLGL